MAYQGWLTFGGTEIFNIERTRTYAENIMPGLQVTDCYPCNCSNLHQILSQQPYSTPALDDAPWYDPQVPLSHGFLGLYPLEVTGLDDDTRSAVVTQSSFDGGFIAAPRRATREVRVSGLLIGEDQGCVDYGLFWLRSLLDVDMRRAKIGRTDPGAETMASIPSMCGQERGTIRFLATCPELGCGVHCNHRAFGSETAYPQSLPSLVATSGTWALVGADWVFTPAGPWSEVRTPNLPDTETCPVTYVWDVEAGPGVLASACAVRDGTLSECTEPREVYEHTNLATNPQWRTTFGTVEVRRNLAINPSMRKVTAPTVAVTNWVTNPNVASTLNGWVIASGTGGSATLSRQGTGPPANVGVGSYANLHWSTAQTDIAVMPYLGFASLSGTDVIPVVPGERAYASGWWRCNVQSTDWHLVVRFYNSSAGYLTGQDIAADLPQVTAVTSNHWQFAEVSGVVPATAAHARILLEKTGGSNMPVGGNLDLTALMFVRDQHATAFFNGSSAARGGLTFAWRGAASASPSDATGVESVVRVNTCLNPVLSVGLDGWGADGGAGNSYTHTRVLSPGLVLAANAIPAFSRIKWTGVTNGAPGGTGFTLGSSVSTSIAPDPPFIAVTQGALTSFSAYVRTSVFDRLARISVDFYAATRLQKIGPTVQGSTVSVGGSAWQRVSLSTTPPVGAEWAVLSIDCASGRNWVVGDTLDATAVLVEAVAVPGEYFDGSTPATSGYDYAWMGPTGASVSVARRRVSAQQVVARTNYAMNPMQDSSFAPGIVTNDAARWPLTQDASDRTKTVRSATALDFAVSEVTVNGAIYPDVQRWAEGDPATISLDVSTTSTHDLAVNVRVDYSNFDGGYLGGDIVGRNFTITDPNTPVRVWASSPPAPPGTYRVDAIVSIATVGGETIPSGTPVFYDHVMVEKVEGLRPFFTGSGPSLNGLDAVWEGAAGSSRSLAIGVRVNTTVDSTMPLWQTLDVSPAGGQAVSTFASDGLIVSPGDTVASPGLYYSGSLMIRQVGGVVAATNTVDVEAIFYNSGGTALGSAVVADSVGVTGTWQGSTLPASAAGPTGTASVRLRVTRTGTWADANARLEVGDVLFERVSAAGVLPGRFFDGNTPTDTELDYAWSGSPDASASTGTGTTVVSGGTSAFPAVYRSSTHAVSGFSVILPSTGAYIEPVHAAGLNGMIPGSPTVIAFDLFKNSETVTVSLFYDLGGVAQIATVIDTPVNGTVSASAVLPAGATSAWWRITNDGGDAAYVSRVIIEAPIDVAAPFFDGSMPPAFWNGLPDKSTSTLPVVPIEVHLPTGAYNDGRPSFSYLQAEGPVTVHSVTAFYFTPDTVANATAPNWRNLYRATCSEGPHITQEFASRHAAMKKVEFILTCPDPWAYGDPVAAANVVDGAATATMADLTVSPYTPASVDLICNAMQSPFVITDPNCPAIPNAPRPDPVVPCADLTLNRGLLFFIPPTALEELAGTYPVLTVDTVDASVDEMVVRCWPLPTPTATLEDIAACDTRGSLVVGKIVQGRGFVLDCAMQRATMTGVPVTGGKLTMQATHFIYPPFSVPPSGVTDFDPIPLTWPEMYGGNYGYFLLVEYKSTAAMTATLTLLTRR